MSYSIGDLIVYGETGVCRVEEIVERQMANGVCDCYKLAPLYQSCTIFTPVDNGNVFMRPIVTPEEVDAIIESALKAEPEVFPPSAPRELSEKYDKIIKLHDCGALIGLIRSIYAKRMGLIDQKKKLSAVDERFMKKAEDLLFGEIAASLGIEKSEAREYIKNKAE